MRWKATVESDLLAKCGDNWNHIEGVALHSNFNI